ncbi:MAG: hypothetical protein RLZZ361_1581 [Cyanobacteriota bacterium]|jgi:hypothetical protein
MQTATEKLNIPDLVSPKTEFASQRQALAMVSEPAGIGVEKTREALESLSAQTEQTVKNTSSSGFDLNSFIAKHINNPEKTKTRNLYISYANALLHAFATITSFGDSVTTKTLNKIFHNTAFLFTRWIAPISSYGLAALNSFVNKDIVEGFIKAIPPLLLPFVGDANVDTVYGLSCSLNQPYDTVKDRIRAKVNKTKDQVEFLDKKGSIGSNFSVLLNEAKRFLNEFKQGKLNFWNEAIYLYNCPLILGGSLPMLLFARRDRDSFLAKALGFIRNAGGLMGDLGFLKGKDIVKKFIGVMCSISAISSIAKRWVKSENYANALIHLSSALDVSAMALWNTFSGTRDAKSH